MAHNSNIYFMQIVTICMCLTVTAPLSVASRCQASSWNEIQSESMRVIAVLQQKNTSPIQNTGKPRHTPSDDHTTRVSVLVLAIRGPSCLNVDWWRTIIYKSDFGTNIILRAFSCEFFKYTCHKESVIAETNGIGCFCSWQWLLKMI